MSSLAILTRGVVAITSSDTSPKDVTLPAAVKTGSSYRITNIKERRRDVFVQAGTISITDADVGGTKDSAALGTAVDTTASYVLATIREKRTDDYRGATVKLQSSTLVRATFNPPAAGDTIDVEFQVIEAKPRRGAIARLLDANTIRVEWDGTLVAGETIDVSYDLVDLDDIMDELLEIEFQLVRSLGYSGENSVVDLHEYNQAKNPTQFRVRVFDSAANADAATIDIAEGEDLEEGELSRELVTIEWDVETNRRKTIWREVTAMADTPGIS